MQRHSGHSKLLRAKLVKSHHKWFTTDPNKVFHDQLFERVVLEYVLTVAACWWCACKMLNTNSLNFSCRRALVCRIHQGLPSVPTMRASCMGGHTCSPSMLPSLVPSTCYSNRPLHFPVAPDLSPFRVHERCCCMLAIFVGRKRKLLSQAFNNPNRPTPYYLKKEQKYLLPSINKSNTPNSAHPPLYIPPYFYFRLPYRSLHESVPYTAIAP